jgi:hypothetical protein
MPTITQLFTKTRNLCSATSVDFSDANLLLEINEAYENVISKILGYDGFWQFDDSNYTDLPIGIGSLVASQRDYSFDSSLLKILGVSVLDVNGLWQELKPIDQSEMGVDTEEFMKVDGMPQYYDKSGNSLFLYPSPASANVTLTSGLKIYFQRTASIFTSAEVTTGTKVPGFVSLFHYLLSYKASISYCMAYKPERVVMYTNKIVEMEKEMEKFYTKRAKDERQVLTMKPICYR